MPGIGEGSHNCALDRAEISCARIAILLSTHNNKCESGNDFPLILAFE